MATIGIMQGRLLPPVAGRFQCFPGDDWAAEFEAARRSNLASIEWIYDVYGANINPLATDHGIEALRVLSARHDVAIRSLCADYFMDRTFLRTEAGEQAALRDKLCWLIGRCGQAGIKHIVLPFVDASRIETDGELDEVLGLLNLVLPTARQASVELHLETSLPPDKFAALLERLPDPQLKANYDSGNSASLGYRPGDEVAAYGHRIGSIHIKDRVRGGGTVPLGTGNADFPALFEALGRVDYGGDYILQVARGVPGDEISWATQNRRWLDEQLRGAGLTVAREGGGR